MKLAVAISMIVCTIGLQAYRHYKDYQKKQRQVLTSAEQFEIEIIESMSHEEMCKLWRSAPSGHIYFDSSKPYAEIFSKRLFEHFGGITPEISKRIGR
tara:strand:+ start:549 stop:842 length:294 start_codon:yes stop_codon:yes gene_type:complete